MEYLSHYGKKKQRLLAWLIVFYSEKKIASYRGVIPVKTVFLKRSLCNGNGKSCLLDEKRKNAVLEMNALWIKGNHLYVPCHQICQISERRTGRGLTLKRNDIYTKLYSNIAKQILGGKKHLKFWTFTGAWSLTVSTHGEVTHAARIGLFFHLHSKDKPFFE